MNFIVNQFRKLFLFYHIHFFVILFSLCFFSSFIMVKFFEFDKSLFYISICTWMFSSCFIMTFFKKQFYTYKDTLPNTFDKININKNGNHSTKKLHIIEYQLLNGDILRLNSDGSYHNELFATIERGSKKLFRYKNEFLVFDSIEEFQKIAPLQNKINNF